MLQKIKDRPISGRLRYSRKLLVTLNILKRRLDHCFSAFIFLFDINVRQNAFIYLCKDSADDFLWDFSVRMRYGKQDGRQRFFFRL